MNQPNREIILIGDQEPPRSRNDVLQRCRHCRQPVLVRTGRRVRFVGSAAFGWDEEGHLILHGQCRCGAAYLVQDADKFREKVPDPI